MRKFLYGCWRWIIDKPTPVTAWARILLLLGLNVLAWGFLETHILNWFDGRHHQFITDSYANFGFELLSIAATVFIIDGSNNRYQHKKYKYELFRQVKIRSRDVAVEALGKIKSENLWQELLQHYQNSRGRVNFARVQWSDGFSISGINLSGAEFDDADLSGAEMEEINLEGASLNLTKLQKANLIDVNLQRADLRDANLSDAVLRNVEMQGVGLIGANMSGTTLINVNLQDAELMRANMKGIHLSDINLKDADLQGVNLEGVDLRSCNLEGVDFRRANLQRATLDLAELQGVNLADANLLGAELITIFLILHDIELFEEFPLIENTVLPDAKILGRDDAGNLIYDKYLTSGTDMTRYTNPEHPDFWEPDWVKRHKEQQ